MDTEHQWYYIKDGQKAGPNTSGELQGLIASGQLTPADLVWRNGLENWTPISAIGDFKRGTQVTAAEPNPAAAASPSLQAAPSIQSQPRHAAVRGAPRMPAVLQQLTNPFGLLRPVVQPTLLLGLLMVIGGKGCDSLGTRYAQRVEALYETAQNKFDDKYEKRRNSVLIDIEKLQAQQDLSTREQERLDSLRDRLDEIDDEQSEERSRLVRDDWFDLRGAARDARADNQAWGVVREALFVFGTLVLVFGLVVAGFTESGPARWICLIILAIIVFSLYVGGISWISSVPGAMNGL